MASFYKSLANMMKWTISIKAKDSPLKLKSSSFHITCKSKMIFVSYDQRTIKAFNFLFPNRTLFFHVGQYIFNPINDMWNHDPPIYNSWLKPVER